MRSVEAERLSPIFNSDESLSNFHSYNRLSFLVIENAFVWIMEGQTF